MTALLWSLGGAAVASIFTLALTQHVLLKRRWLSARHGPAQERWGDSNKPHSGGAAFTISALTAGLVAVTLWGAEPGFVGVLLSVLLASVFGIADELRPQSPRQKLTLQLLIALVLLGSVGPIPLGGGGLLSGLLTVVWLLAVHNALNMFDNSDGAAGTVALVVTIGLACTAAVLGRLDYALLCGAYTGALAAFLHFNRYPSRIFMGDIGSFQLATFLGGTTIALTWTEGTLDSALQSNLFFLVLFLDVALVSVYRISQNISPFRGDTSHLSHVLIEQLQSPRRWVKILGLLTGALTGAYLLLAHGSLVGPPRDAVLLLAWLLPTAALTAAYLRGLRQRRALAQPPLQRRGYTG